MCLQLVARWNLRTQYTHMVCKCIQVMCTWQDYPPLYSSWGILELANMLDSRYYMFPFISLHRFLFTYTCSFFSRSYVSTWIPFLDSFGAASGSSNELLYMNSLKMKLSVLFGVLQMTVGIILRSQTEGWNLSQLFSGNSFSNVFSFLWGGCHFVLAETRWTIAMFLVNLWITLWDSAWHIPVRPLPLTNSTIITPRNTFFASASLRMIPHYSKTGGRIAQSFRWIQWHHGPLDRRWGNSFYEKNMTDFICECVPMMIFMSLVNNQPLYLKGWGEVVTCNIEELHEIQAQERDSFTDCSCR